MRWQRAALWVVENRIEILQAALGLVFVWFGALKLFGASPAVDLIAVTVPFPTSIVVPVLGVWEVAVGVLLLWGRAVGVTMGLFLALMAGTFATFVLQPRVMFDGNPALLTMEGEFVVKNVVLVAAGLAVGGSLWARRRRGDGRGGEGARGRGDG